MFITIPVTPFALYQQSRDVIELDMNIVICSTRQEYIVEFKSRKFPKDAFPSPSSILVSFLTEFYLNTVAAKTYVCKGKKNL